jgi:glycosyltransferase A (GT-A) superfamily protein (DUF2064 family)
MTSERHALLIFANAAIVDCEHRRWPRALQPLLECNNFPEWTDLGFDVHVFTSLAAVPASSRTERLHRQRGSSFGERLENAIETVSDMGYARVVIVGSDCPDLTPTDIQHAFSVLNERQLVLGPDHRGGCYLIGFKTEDRWRLRGIQWQRDTDFAELLSRFGAENSWRLPVKLDLDTWVDVRLLAGSQSSWRDIAATLLQRFRSHPCCAPLRIRLRTREQRIRWQLPPPNLRSRPF